MAWGDGEGVVVPLPITLLGGVVMTETLTGLLKEFVAVVLMEGGGIT